MCKNSDTSTSGLEEKKLIPLYDDVIGTSQLHNNADKNKLASKWINTGDWFPEATAAIRYYGDSMAEYPTGSILMLKQVDDLSLLIWGRNYCIETSEFRIIRRLQSGKGDTLMAYASNTNTYPDGHQIYEPTVIRKETIRYIWKALGCVIKEYGNKKT